MMQKPANVELGAKRKHVNVDVFLFPRDGLEMEFRKDQAFQCRFVKKNKMLQDGYY